MGKHEIDGVQYAPYGDGWISRVSGGEWASCTDVPDRAIEAETLDRLRKGVAAGVVKPADVAAAVEGLADDAARARVTTSLLTSFQGKKLGVKITRADGTVEES